MTVAYKLVNDEYRSCGCPPELACVYRPGTEVCARADDRHLAFPEGRLYFFTGIKYAAGFLIEHLVKGWTVGYSRLMECELTDAVVHTRRILVSPRCTVLRELDPYEIVTYAPVAGRGLQV